MSTASPSSGGRLWIRLIRGHRAVGDITVACTVDRPQDALREAMYELDLSMPVWLPRHQSDWDAFKLARFTQEHFMESITFDRMEVHYIAPDADRKPPRFTETLPR